MGATCTCTPGFVCPEHRDEKYLYDLAVAIGGAMSRDNERACRTARAVIALTEGTTR